VPGDSPFIPAWLDDSGMDLATFRVYCRILRRAGSTGTCFESIPRIGHECGIGEARTRRAVRWLQEQGAVTVEAQPGRPTLVRVVQEWRPEPVSVPTRATRIETDTGIKTDTGTRISFDTGTRIRTDTRRYSQEGTPRKEIPDGTEGRSAPSGRSRSMTAETAESIQWAAERLAEICTDVDAAEWVRRGSMIRADRSGPARSFADPRRSGISESWGAATLARMREMLEEARRPLPL
jgi:hypothetical protein